MMAVTLIVVAVPEGLPMSVTLSLALNCLLYTSLLHFVGFGQGGFQFGQFLDMVGECMHGFYARQ